MNKKLKNLTKKKWEKSQKKKERMVENGRKKDLS